VQNGSTHQALTANFTLMLGWHFELPRSARIHADGLFITGRISRNKFQFFSTPFRRTLRDVNKSHRERSGEAASPCRNESFGSGQSGAVCGFQKCSPTRSPIPGTSVGARALTIYVYIKTQAGRPTPIINEGLTTVEKLSTCVMCIS
jgi:hypothetical protein